MRLAAALIAIAALSGCAFTEKAERSLEVAGESVVKLKGDADRNLERRMALSRHVAELELSRTVLEVSAQTGGVVSATFAMDMIAAAQELGKRFAAIEAAERANIDGNAANAGRLIGVVIAESDATKSAVEASGPAIRGAIEEVVTARQKLRAAKARAEREAREREEE